MTNAFIVLLLLSSTNALPKGAILLPHREIVTTSEAIWYSTPGGDTKREGGTNFIKEWQAVRTQPMAITIDICTNPVPLEVQTVRTNGVYRWRVQGQPPVPGQVSKE